MEETAIRGTMQRVSINGSSTDYYPKTDFGSVILSKNININQYQNENNEMKNNIQIIGYNGNGSGAKRKKETLEEVVDKVNANFSKLCESSIREVSDSSVDVTDSITNKDKLSTQRSVVAQFNTLNYLLEQTANGINTNINNNVKGKYSDGTVYSGTLLSLHNDIVSITNNIRNNRSHIMKKISNLKSYATMDSTKPSTSLHFSDGYWMLMIYGFFSWDQVYNQTGSANILVDETIQSNRGQVSTKNTYTFPIPINCDTWISIPLFIDARNYSYGNQGDSFDMITFKISSQIGKATFNGYMLGYQIGGVETQHSWN